MTWITDENGVNKSKRKNTKKRFGMPPMSPLKSPLRSPLTKSRIIPFDDGNRNRSRTNESTTMKWIVEKNEDDERTMKGKSIFRLLTPQSKLRSSSSISKDTFSLDEDDDKENQSSRIKNEKLIWNMEGNNAEEIIKKGESECHPLAPQTKLHIKLGADEKDLQVDIPWKTVDEEDDGRGCPQTPLLTHCTTRDEKKKKEKATLPFAKISKQISVSSLRGFISSNVPRKAAYRSEKEKSDEL
eukprot:7488578-Ditylum_brightwellii.AAC.1